jgi:ADP-ribose pyrophosphatase YjhB (NUDIX family)
MLDEINHTHKYYSQDKLFAAVDCIIFGFDKEELKVLCIKRSFEPEIGKWSLVGGFLHRNETLSEAANRILHHYTGIDDIFMEQVATFSDVDRDPAERTISTAFYALINIEEYSDRLSDVFSAQWFSMKEKPDLIFDHNRMVDWALKRLRERASAKPIGFELLPKKFTMRQLQKLYEAIWDTELDKRNFISKINSYDILIKTDEKDFSGSRKGSFLYEFDAEAYKNRSIVNSIFTVKIRK